MMDAEQEKLYRSLKIRLPLERTDRISDLERLMRVKLSFFIVSNSRNGMTTLLREFAKKSSGVYLDVQSLPERVNCEQLDQMIGSGRSPIVFDEICCLFPRMNNMKDALDYLDQLSAKRTVGLRVHPREMEYGLRPSQCEGFRGSILRMLRFEEIEIRNQPYLEFKASVENKFRDIGLQLPERFINYGHELGKWGNLMYSNFYIAEAFRLTVENPSRDISEREVLKYMEIPRSYAPDWKIPGW